MPEPAKDVANSAQPLFYRSLQPLSAALHSDRRVKLGDYRFASETPYVPIVVSEFREAARFYPIVFAASDSTPLAILGLDRRNLFVRDGQWAPEHYVPAYARRYPFGFLKIDGEGRYALGVDVESDTLQCSPDEGIAIFDQGEPTEITRNALSFCQAFQDDADATMAFVRALEKQGLLIDRRADASLADGRKLSLDGFRIVDAQAFAALDGSTVTDWHSKGWLALATFHLNSLDRFPSLVSRLSNRTSAGNAPASDPSPVFEPNKDQ